MNSLTHHTAHATWWSALEITARYGVQIAVTIFLARLLAPSDFGLIAMLLVLTNIGAVLTDAGFGTALIQKRKTSADDESTVFWFNLGAGMLAVALMWLGSGSVAAFFHQPALSDLTRAISWVLLFGALGAVPDALLTQKLEFRARARAQVISSVTSGGIAIAAALGGYGVWSLVIQALTASGVRSACLWVFAHWRPRARFSTTSFHRLFGFGGFMLLSGLLNTISVRLQSLLIGRLFDAGTLGYYSLAQSATQAPTSFIGTLLSRVGLPVFANFADDRQCLRNALRTALDVSMFVFVPCMVGLALVARPLIEEVYGARWGTAAPIASLLALAGALWPIHVLNLTALSAQGHSHRFFYLELLKNLIIVIATLSAARFGTIAVAGSMLAAGFCNAAVNTWYSHRLLGYGALMQLHWTNESLSSVLLAILAAAIVYIGMAMRLRLPAWLQLISICKNIFFAEPRNAKPNE